MVTHLEYSLSFSFFSLLCCARRPQDFPLLRLDDIVDDQSNIVGFSMFNTTHPFYLEFIRSLNLSWREGCDLTYPGPAVSQADGGGGGGLGEEDAGGGGAPRALELARVQEIISKAYVCRVTLSCFIAHSD